MSYLCASLLHFPDVAMLRPIRSGGVISDVDEILAVTILGCGDGDDPYSCTSAMQGMRDAGHIAPVSEWWREEACARALAVLNSGCGLRPSASRALDLGLFAASSRDPTKQHVRVRLALLSGDTSLFQPASPLRWTQRDTSHHPSAVPLDAAFESDGEPHLVLRTLVRDSSRAAPAPVTHVCIVVGEQLIRLRRCDAL